MVKNCGRLIGFLIVFLVFCNINIVFARKYDDERNRIDVENQSDRVQSTTVPTVARESSSVFDTLTGGVVASQASLATSAAANSSDNTVQEEGEIKDDENERKRHSTVNQIEGHHQYYNSTIVVDKERVEAYWNKIRNIPAHKWLSLLHQRAMMLTLSFDFPFYGHPIRNVMVATGGFIYTGDHVHSQLAATQYIAPLMANFDFYLSNDSFVRLNDTGSSFTVIWENVYISDQQDVGKLTFSTTLHKNGDIVFTYFSVPILPKAILDDKHSVKVGLSDAYSIEVVLFDRKITTYEYHRIKFANADISNSTIITLKALPTCLEYTDCASCVNHVTAFNCSWCPKVNRCSSGLDRQKQNWIKRGCDQHNVTEEDSCPARVSETFSKEEAMVAEKEEEPSVIDNSSDSRELNEEETDVTANSNDDTIKKEEDFTKEKVLNTEDVTENTTLKTFEKNNLIANQSKAPTMNPDLM